MNLLSAMSAARAGLPSSYSTIFVPFSQCSTWLPFLTSRALFHSPAGFTTFADGAISA